MNFKNNNLKNNLDLALANIEKNNLEKASNLYKKILKKYPDNFDANFNLGTIFAKNNKLEKSVELLEKAVSINPNNEKIFNNLGLIYLNLGDNEKALETIKKAININPNSPIAYNHLGLIYSNLGNINEAINSYLKSIKLNPNNISANYNIGNLFKRINDIEKSEKYYNKTLELEPIHLPAYNNLLELYDLSNQNEKFEALLKKGESHFEQNSTISLFKAKLFYKLKKFKDVVKILESIKFGLEENFKEDSRLELIAKSYDQLGNYNEAYKFFEQTNELKIKTDKNNANKEIFLDSIKKRISYFSNLNNKDWKAQKKEDNIKDPVFLIGFPRSGTTLLDTILRSHPSIEVLEEKPIIDKYVEKLDKKIESKYENLKSSNSSLKKEMRNFYFDQRSKYSSNNKRSIVIDKMPLNIIYVGEIFRFFPKAKFILAIRHPCDCVLSCFMQNFLLNHAMANFINLNDAAKMYDLVMNLWQIYTNKFSISFHTIKYEDLVLNFKSSVSNLLTFLNLPWSNQVSEFYKTSQKRGMILTPSYNQVSQPLYSKSIGRWKNYEDELSTAKLYLESWIKKYSY
jgi:tetratricopeptide (TPR) repeat protein